MGDVTIRVEGLSKRYRIGQREPYYALRDVLARVVKAPFHRALGVFSSTQSDNGVAPGSDGDGTFWALKDVSFEVKRGEVIGVIGHNGAGKSTLLKILSRITKPTAGRAEIYGRVGSLLEVGTGFHPELTGRENVYLNGAILGMKKAEINHKFDEIVAFAEINKFIDTPVKRYSSGMYVRLAFAVAAHLQSEILLVDEVLAVGDAAFRRKCVGTMEHVARGGRTILFVTHDMLALQTLCSTALLIQGGAVAFHGLTGQAIDRYLARVEQLDQLPLDLREDRPGGTPFHFSGVEFLDSRTMLSSRLLSSGQPLTIRLRYRNTSNSSLHDVGVGIAFFTRTGSLLFSCRSRAVGISLDIPPGEGSTTCSIPKIPLKEGQYSYNLYAEGRNNVLDDVRHAGTIRVEAGDYYGSGCLPAPGQPGVLIEYVWDIPPQTAANKLSLQEEA